MTTSQERLDRLRGAYGEREARGMGDSEKRLARLRDIRNQNRLVHIVRAARNRLHRRCADVDNRVRAFGGDLRSGCGNHAVCAVQIICHVSYPP